MNDLEQNLSASLLEGKGKPSNSITTMAENEHIEEINSSPIQTDDQTLIDDHDHSPVSVDEPYLYDLPNVEGVNKVVMCKLLTVSVVCCVLMIAELVGGLLAGSLAIMTDAAHLFSDLSGFFISIFSLWLTNKPSTKKLTYGYHRAEVIGALGSIILIWGLTIWLIVEAAQRVIHRNFEIDKWFMLGTAIFGLLCNLLMGKILHGKGGHHHHGHDHGHSHGHDHGHSHGHAHKHDHKEDHHNHKEHEKEHDHDHKENKENKGEHDHDHDHDHEHEHDHEHDHNHEHEHEHKHEKKDKGKKKDKKKVDDKGKINLIFNLI